MIINYISNKGITEIRWNLYRKCYKNTSISIENIEKKKKHNQYGGAIRMHTQTQNEVKLLFMAEHI